MKIIQSIILLLVFQITEANKPTSIPDYVYKWDEMNKVNSHLVPYLMLIKKDYEIIDLYYKKLLKIDDFNKNNLESFRYLEAFVFKALKANKIKKEYITKIRRMFIVLYNLKTYEHLRKKQIIWLLEARSINNDKDLITFLFSSLNRRFLNSYVLLILKQNYMHQQIQQWFDKKEIKNYDLIIELLKREQRIFTAFDKKKINAVELLLNEYIFTIKQVFESYDPVNKFYKASHLLYHHNDWLFLQFNKYQALHQVKNILNNLYKDWMYYNDKLLVKKLLIVNDARAFETINSDLNIFKKILDIRNIGKPWFNVNSSYPYGKNREFEKNKLKPFLRTIL